MRFKSSCGHRSLIPSRLPTLYRHGIALRDQKNKSEGNIGMTTTTSTYGQAFLKSFLGNSPDWYKLTIVGFLILNPILFFFVDPFVAGWVLIIEFIFTLALALKCYPLLPGGLLAIEAVF